MGCETYQKPGISILRSSSSSALTLCSCVRFVLETAKDDDALSRHKHQVFRFGGRVIYQSSAAANSPFLQRKPRPGVECMSVHVVSTGSFDREKYYGGGDCDG